MEYIIATCCMKPSTALLSINSFLCLFLLILYTHTSHTSLTSTIIKGIYSLSLSLSLCIGMEALLAVLIVVAIIVLLIIATGSIVLIYIALDMYKRYKNTLTSECILRSLMSADPIKHLAKTVIDNIHTTFKRGIESQKEAPLLPSCYQTQPKPAQYEYDNGDSGTDDGLIDDEATSTCSTLTTTMSNFDESVSNNNKPTDKRFPLRNDNDLDIMKTDKALGQSLKRISSRKNEITRKNDTKVSKPSARKKKDHKNRTVPPSVAPYPPSSLPSPSTSSDEQRDEPQGTLKTKKRKKTKSQPKSLPSAPRIETPPVDGSYQSLPDKLHPQHTLHPVNSNLKRLDSEKPKVKLAIRPTDTARPSLPQSLNETPSIPQLPPQCSLPPMIVIPAAQQGSSSRSGPSPIPISSSKCTDPSTNNCSKAMLPPLRAIPLPGNGSYIYQSLLCCSCPPQSLTLAESVVRRDRADEAASIDDSNNRQRELDLVKFVPNGITGETDEEESSSGDPPSNFPLPELLQSCIPVQSTCSSMYQSTDNTVWEAQQPIAASNLEPEPPTAELVIAPLTLGVLGELEDEEELVVPPQNDPVQEHPATPASDSGDDC